jgi:receptor protein-tyrosine kinase
VPFDTALGLGLGLLIGLALVVLLEKLDRRVRETDELERLWDRPVLSMIPADSDLGRDGIAPPAGPISEAFAMLRGRLRYFNVDRDLRVIMVTSALPGEGKSTTAWNLAVAAARSGTRVLLIDADLRRPTIASRLRLGRTTGLADVLVGIDSFVDTVHSVPIPQRPTESPIVVDVLAAGSPPPNPVEIIESEAMERLLHEARSRYDLVLLDTPPVGIVSDALGLVPRADGLLVVTRLNHITRDAARRFRQELESLDAPLIGVVANAVPRQGDGYYGYGYGYEPQPDDSPEIREEPAPVEPGR